MKKVFINILGWYGTLAIVIAYLLVSFSYIQANSILYQILNGTGAVGIVIVSLYKKAYQPAVLNIIWTLIAIVSIINIFK